MISIEFINNNCYKIIYQTIRGEQANKVLKVGDKSYRIESALVPQNCLKVWGILYIQGSSIRNDGLLCSVNDEEKDLLLRLIDLYNS